MHELAEHKKGHDRVLFYGHATLALWSSTLFKKGYMRLDDLF